MTVAPSLCGASPTYRIISKSKWIKNFTLFLFHEILNRFSINRQNFLELTNDRDRVEELLLEGAIKARKQAQNVLKRVRSRVGY